MGKPWQSDEARERFVRFLELELMLVGCSSLEDVDPEILAEFDTLLTDCFPRTLAFFEDKVSEDPNEGLTDAASIVAWAEARSLSVDGEKAKVPGEWTEGEIAEDINGCFRIAVRRLSVLPE